jgi:hypothetical protein
MVPRWPPRSLARCARAGVVLGWSKGRRWLRAQSPRWQKLTFLVEMWVLWMMLGVLVYMIGNSLDCHRGVERRPSESGHGSRSGLKWRARPAVHLTGWDSAEEPAAHGGDVGHQPTVGASPRRLDFETLSQLTCRKFWPQMPSKRHDLD